MGGKSAPSRATVERALVVEKKREQLLVARINVAGCEAELARPSPGLAYVQPSTWARLLEHWQAWVARLEGQGVR